MPNPMDGAKLSKFQMFLELCEVARTIGEKLPPGLYLVFDTYSYHVIKSVPNDLLSAQIKLGSRLAAVVRQVDTTGFRI